jgi:uncharacterized protein YcaQ
VKDKDSGNLGLKPLTQHPAAKTRKEIRFVIELTRAEARRFLVRRHLLAPPRSLPPTHDAVMNVVRLLGSLQFDPLEAPGARNHDLVLAARIRDYDPALVRGLLYPARAKSRTLFEAYNKSLNILPIDELPWHRFAWKRASRGHAGALLAKHRSVTTSMLSRLRKDGPLPSAAFDRSTKVRGYWGADTSLSRHVLDALFMTGRVGIASRDGNARSYDLIARLFSPALLKRRVSDDEATAHRLLSRHRAVGLMGERSAPELVAGLGDQKTRRRHLAELIARGALVPVRVEGQKDVRSILPAEQALLHVQSPLEPREVTLLAPLDPLVWDRRLLLDLFDFAYTWEVYTPVAKRKHGYYVLPILFGDRLVGRIEPRFDRATRKLHIVNVWLEKGFDRGEPGFESALERAIHAHSHMVGAEVVTAVRARRR